LFAPFRQFVPSDDFDSEVHGAIFMQPPPIGNDLAKVGVEVTRLILLYFSIRNSLCRLLQK
jgi:hypothetical protein